MSPTNTAFSDPARAFLEEVRFAIMATVMPDGTPQQSVMWYALRDDHIIMNTKVGRVKHNNLERDPVVSLCFEDAYRYITVRGRVELVYDQPTVQADIRTLAIRYHGETAGNLQSIEHFSKEQRVTLLISIERVIEYGFDEA